MKRCLECEQVFSSEQWTCPACGYQPESLSGFPAHAANLAKGGGGFKPEYFRQLAELESGNFWFRARNRLILWALRNYRPDAASFMEVGCGTGYVLSGIAGSHPEMRICGSEIFVDGLFYAAERVPGADFMQMDARKIPFVEEFDAIGAFDVLEHIEQDRLVLEQLCNALKPGGVLFLTVPQHPWLWSASDDYAQHVRRYTRVELEEKIRSSGFELLRSTSFVSVLLPVMMLSRELQKRMEKSFEPVDELKIGNILNWVFMNLMMAEQAGIRLGMNYPVGGSRLIVARKSN